MNNKPQRTWAGLLLACCWLAGVGLARADGVPPFLNYQGVLANGDGQPLTNKNLTVNFRIYDAVRGGNMIWGTRMLVTTDSNGVFNCSLGDFPPQYRYALVYIGEYMRAAVGAMVRFPCDPAAPFSDDNPAGCLRCQFANPDYAHSEFSLTTRFGDGTGCTAPAEVRARSMWSPWPSPAITVSAAATSMRPWSTTS